MFQTLGESFVRKLWQNRWPEERKELLRLVMVDIGECGLAQTNEGIVVWKLSIAIGRLQEQLVLQSRMSSCPTRNLVGLTMESITPV